MRLAISAVAAVSGLLLLGLAFYGQPALYLHQAREQWNALIDAPAADQSDEPDRNAAVERTTGLQQQVTQLENELATRRTAVPRPAVTEPTLPAPDQPAPAQLSPAPPAALGPDRQAAAPEPAAPQPPAPSTAQRETGQLQTGQLQTGEAMPPAIIIPERHVAAAVDKVQPVPESLKTETAKTEPAKPVPPKLASLKPVPAPPPLPPSARQDPNDTQSVLARLRQVAAGSPTQQTKPPPSVEAAPRPAPPPSLPKLAAARTALVSGRIEDARRLLQEAQLQLVFRPVNAAGDDQPAARNGAADVAHALDALSANDVSLSRRYVDLAVNDLSGSGASPAAQESPAVQDSEARPSGYSPAYPPR